MISRATLFSTPGGDTIQVCGTAEHLRRLGIDVDIRLADENNIDYSQYDLLHLFNLIRPNDLLKHALQSGKPYVLSTIYVDYYEYEVNVRGGVSKIFLKLFGRFGAEYIKVLGRAVKNGEKIVSRSYLWQGQRKAMINLALGASYLLPNSLSEMRRIELLLGMTNKYKVIPNGIDEELFAEPLRKTNRQGVICVARIEGRKNQLNLIQAMNGLDIELVIVGRPSPNHQLYYNECRSIAGANVKFLDHMPQAELRQLYAAAKVHILPSWFETTGLSSLEAAIMGCNIVVTRKGDTEEYFGNLAVYCEPDNIESIKGAIMEAYNKPNSELTRLRIAKHFTWKIAATKTLEVYKSVLGRC
ncbi:glycosyltransferase family 4 protein [Pseudocnuella soli]|uniref:glycosyltransferase family 4 protein n=1 Tax=Pseudocnuella soli TaxID=2502779 RepID=UPI001404509B|nr:glycosyltransferase family 4 protein [Pseudocnuella soli]